MSQENIDKKILKALSKFNPDLTGKCVLTEAASGNFASTSVIAALAGAEVFAYTKNSRYATVAGVRKQVNHLATQLGVERKLNIIETLDDVDFSKIDVVTNNGFLRPINAAFIDRLSPKCVIPLMWEPWEYRSSDLDIEACRAKCIKVYGTNETDYRLRTMEYIGYVLMKILLNNGCSPFSARLLALGCEHFVEPSVSVLRNSGYNVDAITDYSEKIDKLDNYDVILLLEHERNIPLIGGEGTFLKAANLPGSTIILHICGNINVNSLERFKVIPDKPAPFGHMSFSTDYADSQSVVDLHTAGLKVAEGMLEANKLGLFGSAYREFMESNYPAMAFDKPEYW